MLWILSFCIFLFPGHFVPRSVVPDEHCAVSELGFGEVHDKSVRVASACNYYSEAPEAQRAAKRIPILTGKN